MRAAIILVFAIACLAAPTAEAGGNMAVCVAIQQNFNNCAAQQQRQAQWNEWREWHGGGGPYGHHHWRRRPIDCTSWIYALKANNCF